MTPQQQNFLDNLTVNRAQKLIATFHSDPAIAASCGPDCLHAFRVCWEFLNPGEYIQRYDGPAGVEYRFISN